MMKSVRMILIVAICSLPLSIATFGQATPQIRISVVGGKAHAPQNDLEKQLALFTPQQFLDLANKRNLVVDVQYTTADLQGTGQFDFVIAGYEASLLGTIRAFQLSQGKLTLVGEPEGSPDLGGGRLEVELVDVQGTGRPEIAVRSFGATETYTLTVYGFTGSSLRPLNRDPNDENIFGGAELFDVDSDGVLEIVTPSSGQWVIDPNKPQVGTTPFGVYKFDGTSFRLSFTSPTDPTGRISGNGQFNQSVYGRTRVEPDHFTLAQTRKSVEKHESEEGEVLLRLGNLSAPVSATPGPVSAENFDLKSLVLGRAIHPLKVEIVQGDGADGSAEGQQPNDQGTQPSKLRGPLVQAHFSREAVLQFLPRTQLSKPLAPGDSLTLELRGKMKNGAPVFSAVKVTVTGDRDDKAQN